MRTEASFADRLIVILATGRSGSTWLNQLLLSHPRIAGVDEGETAIFHGLADYWDNVHGRWGPGMGRAIGEDQAMEAMRRFCDYAFASCRDTHRPSADYFLEKTPGHADRLAWVRRIYPSAWYVHLIRDGRDVVRSTGKMWFGSRFLSRDATRWASAVSSARRDLAGVERSREVRYERLLADPVDTTCELLSWMGLEPGTDVVKAIAHRSSKAVATYTGERTVGSGKWRHDLSRWDLGQIYRCAGTQLVELGYLEPSELARWRRRPHYWYGDLMAKRPAALMDRLDRGRRTARH